MIQAQHKWYQDSSKSFQFPFHRHVVSMWAMVQELMLLRKQEIDSEEQQTWIYGLTVNTKWATVSWPRACIFQLSYNMRTAVIRVMAVTYEQSISNSGAILCICLLNSRVIFSTRVSFDVNVLFIVMWRWNFRVLLCQVFGVSFFFIFSAAFETSITTIC